jgi:hypothetical protein
VHESTPIETGIQTPETTLGVISGIAASLAVLHTPGKVYEVRIPKSGTKATQSGWFDNHAQAATAIAQLDGQFPAIYTTLNSTNPSLLARANNKILAAKATTNKGDITHRDWLLIDADPVRPSGISSTDEEKSRALETLQKVVNHLADRGFPSPVTADSGNGYHALYRLDLPNTPEVETAVRSTLKHLDKKFSTDTVKIDTAVHDPNRITKCYGTLACKGEATPERPHRRSVLRRVPKTIVPVTLEQMTALGPKSGIIIKKKYDSNLPPVTSEKMLTFFDFYGLEYGEAQERPEGGLMWTVQDCPFNPVHDYAVFLTADGVPGFKCFHSSANCCDKHFAEYHKILQEQTGKKFFFHTNNEVTPSSAPAVAKLNVQKASEIKPESIEWLWDGRIAIGKLTLFLGIPGIGKGLATMDVASRVSTGKPFPEAPNNNPPSDVLIFSSEDAAGDTLVPRLMAVGADLTRIGIVETTTTSDGVKQFSLDTDLPALRAALIDNPKLKLIIIDPLLNHLGKLNGNKEQDVRSALTPLGELAKEFKVAILVVTHPNKRSDVDAIASAGGAMAVVGCMRTAWRFMASKDEEGLRYMAPMKSNLANSGMSIAYETVGEIIQIDGKDTEIGRIKWGSESSITLDDLMPGEKAQKVTKYDKCVTWMVTVLEAGPVPATKVEADGKERGFGEGTIKKAKSDLKVKSVEKTVDGKKQWFWVLPNGNQEGDSNE